VITAHFTNDTCMKNRCVAALVLSLLALTSIAWTENARGQTNLVRVGILSFFPVGDNPGSEPWVGPVREILAARGWVDGKNVSFEYRSAQSDPSKFLKAAKELVEADVNVIYALSAPALHAAYAITRTVPIVAVDFTTDPIARGYIETYSRPGGNVTGVFLDAPEFAGKWFDLLKATVPNLSHVAVLWDPGPGDSHLFAVRGVAESLDIKLQVLEVHQPRDIDKAFEAFSVKTQAVVILPSPLSYNQSSRLATLALNYRLPATSIFTEFTETGGTLAYGPETTLTDERIAILVAKVLGGSKPANLPVERPTKFRLSVNLKTAEVLGLNIPQSILLRADEVIR